MIADGPEPDRIPRCSDQGARAAVGQRDSFHVNVARLLQERSAGSDHQSPTCVQAEVLEQFRGLDASTSSDRIRTGLDERGGSFIPEASGRVVEPRIVGPPADVSCHLDVPRFRAAVCNGL
jgi:hypothetical protein